MECTSVLVDREKAELWKSDSDFHGSPLFVRVRYLTDLRPLHSNLIISV